MSIPNDIREIRKQKYMTSRQEVQPVVSYAPLSNNDEPIESIIARISLYENDVKFAQHLSSTHDPTADGSIRPPIKDKVECLIPSTPIARPQFLTEWQCLVCDCINHPSHVICRHCGHMYPYFT